MSKQIIPRAIDYFTGKALEFEDFDEDEDFDEIDDDDDDEDDFEDDVCLYRLSLLPLHVPNVFLCVSRIRTRTVMCPPGDVDRQSW